MIDPKDWYTRLGLLPVPLFAVSDTEETGERFVLLNGLRGSFCLALGNPTPWSAARNHAWSANVAHYVSVTEKDVRVQRWDRPPGDTEDHDLREVEAQLAKFHASLEREGLSYDQSVIAHALRVFRSLRAALGDSVDGGKALSVFLYLIACELDNVERSDLDCSIWHLNPDTEELSNSLDQDQWQALVRDLRNGRPLEQLQPVMSLVLRHAAGLLFQEAHYEALFAPSQQLNLRIFAPPPVALSEHTTAVGVHFTPAAIVRTVVEECINSIDPLPRKLSILDPACGSGEFLREVLRQLSLRRYAGEVVLMGYDISPAACEMARFVLRWEASRCGIATQIQIKNVDALAIEKQWPTSLDMVLMNPPFVSWGDMTDSQRATALQLLEGRVKIRPDLSAAFLHKAASHLKPYGVLGSVLPASFLDGLSFTSLREDLGHRLAPVLIARLGSHQLFPGARVDPGLYVATNRNGQVSPPLAFWADHRESSTSAAMRALRRLRNHSTGSVFPAVGEGYSIYPNPDIGRTGASWAPRPYRQWRVLTSVKSNKKVADCFSVMQGALSGRNAAFLLTKEEMNTLPKREREYFRPALLNESVEDGKLNDRVFIFYPYAGRNIDSETNLKAYLPRYYHSHLKPHKRALQERKGIDSKSWWHLTRHRAWQMASPPKLVSTYFGDIGSFAWDENGSFVVVQGYGWLPRGGGKLSKKIWLAYLAILNSPLFSDLLAASANHVGGGQWNLSKRFMKDIPFPDLTVFDDASVIDDLSLIGDLIHQGDRTETMKSSEYGKLVDAVYELGLRL